MSLVNFFSRSAQTPKERKRLEQLRVDADRFHIISGRFPWIWKIHGDWHHQRELPSWVPISIDDDLVNFHRILMITQEMKDVEFWLYQRARTRSVPQKIDFSAKRDKVLACAVERALFVDGLRELVLVVVDLDKAGRKRLRLFDPVRASIGIEDLVERIKKQSVSPWNE